MIQYEPSPAGFIQFCAALYESPGVAKTCLALQDARGWNVNCLLLCAWAPRLGRSLTPEFWPHARRTIEILDSDAVTPIRQLRRSISKHRKLDEDLKAGIKRLLWYAELRAEQAVESALHRAMVSYAPAGASDPLSNLIACTGEDSPDVRRLAELFSESIAN
jgi:uncharacterized protein (TIGR02444 family)